jgi:hypothetical protein
MYSPSEGYLVRVKVVPTRFAPDLGWLVAQDVLDRVGGILDSGIQQKV